MVDMSVLENMYPVSALSRGSASRVLSSAVGGRPAIIVKNNSPYRVITSVEDYAYLMELEEDMALLGEAMKRLEHGERTIPAATVYSELGIDLEELDAMDDVEFD